MALACGIEKKSSDDSADELVILNSALDSKQAVATGVYPVNTCLDVTKKRYANNKETKNVTPVALSRNLDIKFGKVSQDVRVTTYTDFQCQNAADEFVYLKSAKPARVACLCQATSRR